MYCEFSPMTDAEIRKSFTDLEFKVKFRPVYVAVDLDPEKIVIPVLEQVRELLDMGEAPASRKSCPDCTLIDAFASLLSDEDLLDSAPEYYNKTERDHFYARKSIRNPKDHAARRSLVMRAIIGAADPLGVLRNWDWSTDEPQVEELQ